MSSSVLQRVASSLAVPPSPEVAALCAAAVNVGSQELDVSFGSNLGSDVAVIAAVAAHLQVMLAQRMAAWQSSDSTADPVGAAVHSGIELTHARKLRRAAAFAAKHPDIGQPWRDLEVTTAQVSIIATVTKRLPAGDIDTILQCIAPALAGMTLSETRTAVEGAVQLAHPTEAQKREREDYEERGIAWTGIRGGLEIRGYLPPVEAGAFTAAIDALAEQLRAEGDGLTLAQRRADALAALVARAVAHGLPAGGGLPASVTLLVSADEAARIAGIDPSAGCPGRRPDPAVTASGLPVGEAAVRFALCCAPITPAHHHQAAADGSLLARLLGTPIAPLQMGRAVRLATTSQRRALQVRDGGCIIPGCGTGAAYTQPHHVVPWSLGGATDLDNLASLCFVHHRQVELGTWVIEPAALGDPRRWVARRRG